MHNRATGCSPKLLTTNHPSPLLLQWQLCCCAFLIECNSRTLMTAGSPWNVLLITHTSQPTDKHYNDGFGKGACLDNHNHNNSKNDNEDNVTLSSSWWARYETGACLTCMGPTPSPPWVTASSRVPIITRKCINTIIVIINIATINMISVLLVGLWW